MKYFIILTVLSFIAFAKSPKRKISNTNYYYCSIEINGDLNKNYRSEFVIPLMQEAEETEVKRSKRWNTVSVTLTTNYQIKVNVFEKYRSHNDEKEKIISPEGLAYNNPVQVDEEIKLKLDDKEIVYRLQCE